MNVLSVVIPTHNRCDILRKAISAYLKQTALQAIGEILVVDDGSTDATGGVVAQLAQGSAIPIRYFRQENKGPAAARNVGIREAASELILFTDDDIIPGPVLVAEHLDWHNRFSEISTAVLGYVTWAPEVKPTPFMKWYGSGGSLYAYAHIDGRTEIDYRYFYTCNLSLKTEFLRKNGTFDEDFKVAAFEDIELGYRLNKVGMRLLYNPAAWAYHQQYVSFEDACRRAKKAAVSAEVYRRKEAGGHDALCQQMHWTYRLTSRFTLKLVRWAEPILSPFKGFIDGMVPLPWIIYRMMLRLFGE